MHLPAVAAGIPGEVEMNGWYWCASVALRREKLQTECWVEVCTSLWTESPTPLYWALDADHLEENQMGR